MADATPATNPSALTLSDLNTAINHEPRIHDLILAERLGFARPRAVRQIIERNQAELELHGSLATQCGKSRGQEFKEYWLNEGQALVICALSRTQAAAEIRRQVIQVYMDWRRAQAGLTATDQDGRALALTEHEIMMVRAFRAQVEQATAPAIIRGVNAEIARLRTDTSKALQIAMDVVVLREMERRGEMG